MTVRSYATAGPRPASPHMPANRIVRALSSTPVASGRPLPQTARGRLERSLQTDLSSVRIKTGSSSDAAARELGARAFTLGRDIHFRSGEYDPSSHAGFTLLSHEVVHTVTHGHTARHTRPERVELSSPDETAEREAAAAASSIAAGGRVNVSRAAPNGAPRIFRDVDRTRMEADRVAEELRTLIGGATWREIRKRVYPKESAAGIVRASERKAGLRTDLTGLGRIKNLEHLAGAIRGMQSTWSTLTVDKRIKAVTKAANDELADADVPAFLTSDKMKMEFKAGFSPAAWGFVLSEALVTNSSLSNDDGADLANSTMHESRHAEQNFLAARFQAGVNKKSADQIVAEDGIPKAIATKAVQKKFDANTDASVVDLGRRMFDAAVTDRAKNQAISDDDGLIELRRKRAGAQTALNRLNSSKTRDNTIDGKTAAAELNRQIAVVEQRYTDYRNIPYEADAHEVGDAAEQAFRGWPGVAQVQAKAKAQEERPEPRRGPNP